MAAHPDWKLNVAGHTDNIGGDAFNLQLSQQRAEAVKTALVAQYKISADRLTTGDMGRRVRWRRMTRWKDARETGAWSFQNSRREARLVSEERMMAQKCAKWICVVLTLARLKQRGRRGRAGAIHVVSKNGIVASESPLASQAGAHILEKGERSGRGDCDERDDGVVEPMMNGIGGDLFAIVYDVKANKLYGLMRAGGRRRG